MNIRSVGRAIYIRCALSIQFGVRVIHRCALSIGKCGTVLLCRATLYNSSKPNPAATQNEITDPTRPHELKVRRTSEAAVAYFTAFYKQST
jgi:hypothetical protein